MNEKVENLKGKLIVSCQTPPHEPLHSSFIMGRMALTAKEGEACGVRASTGKDIAEVQTRVDLPVVGIVKRDYEDSKIHITPAMKEINGLMEVKSDIIALGATHSLRPGGRTLDKFYREVRRSYPEQLLVADCPIVEEALHVDQLEFDFIGTTLVGYTNQNRDFKIESNDPEIIRQIMAKVKHRAIAEGNINMPEKAKRVIELGVFGVAVGPIITRPQLITEFFVEALGQYKYINHFTIKGT